MVERNNKTSDKQKISYLAASMLNSKRKEKKTGKKCTAKIDTTRLRGGKEKHHLQMNEFWHKN